MVRIEVIPNRDILNIADYEDASIFAGHGELFKIFCKKKKVPIDLPYIGGQYWAKEIAHLGHIAIMEDHFGICAYANYKLDRYQRNKIVTKREYWRQTNFSGVVVMEDKKKKNFDRELLKMSIRQRMPELDDDKIIVTSDDVIMKFTEELTPVVERPKININTRRTQFRNR